MELLPFNYINNYLQNNSQTTGTIPIRVYTHKERYIIVIFSFQAVTVNSVDLDYQQLKDFKQPPKNSFKVGNQQELRHDKSCTSDRMTKVCAVLSLFVYTYSDITVRKEFHVLNHYFRIYNPRVYYSGSCLDYGYTRLGPQRWNYT